MEITIQHQIEKTFHTFDVNDPDKLTDEEVRMICWDMNVVAIFENTRTVNP